MTSSVIRSDNYIQISGWMVTELGLKGNELIVYALIHGFSQDGKSVFNGGLNYVKAWTNLNRRTCMNTIKNLIDSHLIIRRERKDAIPYQDPPYEYYTVRSRPDEFLPEKTILSQEKKYQVKQHTSLQDNLISEGDMDSVKVPEEDNTEKRKAIIFNYIDKLFCGQVDANDRLCLSLDKELSIAGINSDEYTEYIAWAYGYLLEKCRDPKNLPGYFYKSIQKPDLINKFKNFQIEKKDAEIKAREAEISCLICGTLHHRNYRCPTCNNSYYELKILSEEQLFKMRQYFFLSPEKKAAYCRELGVIHKQYPSSIILRNKKLKEEMDKSIRKLDLKYGMINEGNLNEKIS